MELKANVYYEANTQGMFFDVDSLTLSHLYLPIIGLKAHTIYSVLLGEAISNFRKLKICPQISRIQKITNLSISEIDSATAYLEGVGLLKTYYKTSSNPINNNEEAIITYVIYPPKTPRSFFDNYFLLNRLFEVLGDHDFKRTEFFFKENIPNLAKCTEITRKLSDVFENRKFKEDSRQKINVSKLQTREKLPLVNATFLNINQHLENLDSDYRISSIKDQNTIYKILSYPETSGTKNKDIARAIMASLKVDDAQKLDFNFIKKFIINEREIASQSAKVNQHFALDAKSSNIDLTNIDKYSDNLIQDYLDIFGIEPSTEIKNILIKNLSEFDYEVVKVTLSFLYTKRQSNSRSLNTKYYLKVLSTIRDNGWSRNVNAVNNHFAKISNHNGFTNEIFLNNKPSEKPRDVFSFSKSKNKDIDEWEF